MSEYTVIEHLQNELKDFLVSMIPVPWERIVFWAKYSKSGSSVRFGFKEKETGVVVPMDFFFDRYESYPIKKMDIYKNQYLFTKIINEAYLKQYGENREWSTFTLIIDKDGEFKTEFNFEAPNETAFSEVEWFLKTYFGVEYVWVKGKYPSKE